MKKILLATTALAMSSTLAAAEISFSGDGRFGLEYDDGAAPGVPETTIEARMRVNINASVETDAGVKFGGRIRIRSDNGTGESTASAAYVYAEMAGFTIQVGNANTALDSADLYFASAIGFVDNSFGDNQAGITGYSSGPYTGTPNRMGIFASYEVGDFVGRISYTDENQSIDTDASEIQISADYTFGAVSVSAGYADNAEFVQTSTVTFLGAQYAFNDAGNVGILFYDNNFVGTASDFSQVTVYGDYTFGATTVKAYVANNDNATNVTDNVYGLGVSYDLGGATAAFDINQGYDEETVAALGVSFKF